MFSGTFHSTVLPHRVIEASPQWKTAAVEPSWRLWRVTTESRIAFYVGRAHCVARVLSP